MRKLLTFILIAFCLAPFNCYCQEQNQNILLDYAANKIRNLVIENGYEAEPVSAISEDRSFLSFTYTRGTHMYVVIIGGKGDVFSVTHQTVITFFTKEKTHAKDKKLISIICNQSNRDDKVFHFYYENEEDKILVNIRNWHFYSKKNFNVDEFMLINETYIECIHEAKEKFMTKLLKYLRENMSQPSL